ncbi:MAG: extracellular solute-binding protein [Clostridia bacterium]|nr:extracellular solute-binding protein [Clostridia bacterium]
MLKKLVSLVLVLAVVAAMPFAVQAESNPVRIEFWFGLGGNLGNIVLNAIDSFNASQDEIFVVGVQQASYGDTDTAIRAAMAANDVPSCFLTGSGWWAKRDSGIFEILDDYIAADENMDINDYMESAMLTDKDSAGRVIGLPLYATSQVLYYDVAAFENAGIDPEWAFKNWQNLAEAAAKLAVIKDGETVYFGWEPMYGPENVKDIVFSAGGTIYADEERKTVNFLTDEWIDVMTSLRKWLHEDKIMGIHFGGEGWEYWYKTIDDVMEGRAAGYTGSAGDQGDLDFTKLAAHIQPGWGDHPTQPQTDGPSVYILSSAAPEQKKAAYKFLTYLTSAKVQGEISMKSGYIPVRKSTLEDPEYAAFIAEHPHAVVPMQQLEYCTAEFLDITGGGIGDALSDLVDRIEIEGSDVMEALTICQEEAQAALDEFWAEQE